MSTEQRTSDQTALSTTLSGFWNNLRQGRVISYKWMAILLILVTAIGVTWYIVSERRIAASQRWMAEEDANTQDAQREIAEKYPDTNLEKLARLQIARALLGESGIELLSSNTSEQRTKGVENIEKAREMFQKLIEDFKKDPVFQAQCLLGVAKAEAALVAVPATPGQLTEFKGKIPVVVEYLDRLSEIAAPETSWATDSKKLADALRNEQSPSADEFKRIQRALFDLKTTTPSLPKFDEPLSPFGTGGGLGGGPAIPGLPR